MQRPQQPDPPRTAVVELDALRRIAVPAFAKQVAQFPFPVFTEAAARYGYYVPQLERVIMAAAMIADTAAIAVPPKD